MRLTKKISLLLLCLMLGMTTLTGCAKTAVEEEAEAQATLHENNMATVEAFVQSNFCELLPAATSDVLQMYLASGQVYFSPTFANDFLLRWQTFEDKHGAVVSAVMPENAVTEKEGSYSVQIILTGEDDAQMLLTIDFNQQVQPLKTTLADYSDDASQTLGQRMLNAGGNIVVGLLVVFAMLILLCFIISSFTLINKASVKKPAPAAEKKAAPAPQAAPAPVVPAQDNNELIAVIAAAIAAAEGTSTDGFVVRSIRRLDSNKWR